MKPSPETQAVVRALAILRDVVKAHEMGDASVLQTVRLNIEEAREILGLVKGTRVYARRRWNHGSK